MQANADSNRDSIVFDSEVFAQSQSIAYRNIGELIITNPVVIMGPNKPGNEPWVTVESYISHEQSLGIRIKSSNVTISNLSFLNFNTGLFVEPGSDYITIKDCHLAGNKGCQLYAEATRYLQISDCYFGTTANGDSSYNYAAQGEGIWLYNCVDMNNTITNCVFGGLGLDAIHLEGCSYQYIQSNRIGTNLAESNKMPNGGNGILIVGNAIGLEISENVIVNSLKNGIYLQDGSENYIFNNFIGTTTGKQPMPNGQSGIMITGKSIENSIGSEEEGINQICFNMEYGIKMDSISSYGNIITYNNLSCNQFGGIALENEANGRFIAPVIYSVSQNLGITGASPTQTGRIFVYATNPQCAGDCAGEVRLLSESVSPTPGNGEFEISWDPSWNELFITNPATRITVLIFDPNTGNTSPFSNCVQPCLLRTPNEIPKQYFCKAGETFDAKPFFDEVNPKGGTANIKYKWMLGREIVSNSSILTIPQPGHYILEVLGCNDSSFFTIGVDFETFDFFIDAGEDRIINAGESYQIEALPSTRNWKSCSWKPTTGLIGKTDVINPIAKPTETTTYTISMEFDNGCIREDSITVAIEPVILARWGMNPTGSMKEYPASLQTLGNGQVAAMGTFQGSLQWGTESIVTPGAQDNVFLLLADENGNPRIGRKGGGMSIDRVISSAKDSKNNVWMTGVFSGTLVIGMDTLVSDAGDDIFLAKFDENGNPRIGRKGGGMSIDRVSGITVDKNDNVYLTGLFSEKIVFGSVAVEASVPDELYVFKFDENGNPRIGRKGGGMSIDRVSGITVDKDDNVQVVGSLKGTFQMDNTFATTSNGNESMFAVTLDQSLIATNSITSQALDAGAVNRISQITRDKEGNLIVVGETKGSFRIGQLNLPALPNAQSTDIFMAKLSPELKPIWGKKFIGKSNEKVSSVVVDSENNIYLGGTFSNLMTAGGKPLISKGGRDFFLIKMGGNGRLMWNVAGGGADDDTLAAMATDAKGALYLMGSVGDRASFMDRNFSASGGKDLFLMKIAPKSVSIAEMEAKTALSLYPNPNKGTFQIHLPEGNKGKLTVTDLLGKAVAHTFEVQDDETATVKLSEGSARGVYFLQYTSDQGTWTGKMIVE